MTVDQNLSDFTILVVDDSPINHRVVTLSLRGRISHIDSAYNGLEALEKYKGSRYDVILMDVKMPVMDGCESAIAIRKFETEQQTDKKAFIIAMTASDGFGEIKQCMEAGMNAYLGKPFNTENFLRLMAEEYKP